MLGVYRAECVKKNFGMRTNLSLTASYYEQSTRHQNPKPLTSDAGSRRRDEAQQSEQGHGPLLRGLLRCAACDPGPPQSARQAAGRPGSTHRPSAARQRSHVPPKGLPAVRGQSGIDLPCLFR